MLHQILATFFTNWFLVLFILNLLHFFTGLVSRVIILLLFVSTRHSLFAAIFTIFYKLSYKPYLFLFLIQILNFNKPIYKITYKKKYFIFHKSIFYKKNESYIKLIIFFENFNIFFKVKKVSKIIKNC